MAGLRIVLVLMHNLFRNRRELALENLALRQQLTVFEAKKLRPRLRKRDRIFWVSVAHLGGLAHRAGDRPARYRGSLASARFSFVLAMEVAAENGGATENRHRDP